MPLVPHLDSSPLKPRARATYDGLVTVLADSLSGARPIALGSLLYPIEAGYLQKLLDVQAALPAGQSFYLPPALTARVHEVAEYILDGPRYGALSSVADRIAMGCAAGKKLQRGDVDQLKNTLEEVLASDARVRICDLRKLLPAEFKRQGHAPHTISRQPWQIVPSAKVKLDGDSQRAFSTVYSVVDRESWTNPWSFREEIGFRRAQRALRYHVKKALRAESGTPGRNGSAKRGLKDPRVRQELREICRLSRKLQDLFELMYHPQGHAPWEYRWIMAQWARPHAPRVVNVVNVGRNLILSLLNHYFERIGLEPYPLLGGHEEFPPGWIPEGSVPKEPMRWTLEKFQEEYEELMRIGMKHLGEELDAAQRELESRDHLPQLPFDPPLPPAASPAQPPPVSEPPSKSSA